MTRTPLNRCWAPASLTYVADRYHIGLNDTFNDLINTPIPDAYKAKDQALYRGHCVEG